MINWAAYTKRHGCFNRRVYRASRAGNDAKRVYLADTSFDRNRARLARQQYDEWIQREARQAAWDKAHGRKRIA